MNSIKDIIVHVFKTDQLPGAPQYLHFFDDKEIMKKEFENYSVKNEFDHSFIYYQNQEAIALWKNKAGQVQFCGSGAYALASEIIKEHNLENLLIKSDFINLQAFKEDQKIKLEIPAFLPKPTPGIDQHQLFTYQNSGIYLLKLESLEKLKDDDYLKNYRDALEQKHPDNIHGFCAFFWDKDQGYLRYFTPWHGREEDYVTGSIQMYLTPLVYEVFGVRDQQWEQKMGSYKVVLLREKGNNICYRSLIFIN